MEVLQVELHHISKFITEDRLFKAGLSIHIGRSHALPLKRSNPSTQKLSRERPKDDDAPVLKKKKTSGEAIPKKDFAKTSNNLNEGVRLPQIHIPEEVLKHICKGRQQTDGLVSQALGAVAHLNVALDEWNSEFVKIKYLRGECEKRLLVETKKVAVLGDELAECRTELANMATTLSLQRQEVDRSREELVDVRADVREKERRTRDLVLEMKALRKENTRLQKDISEKESALSRDRTAAVTLKAVEDFKKSLSCQSMIEDHIQKARDIIFDAEVKELERQSLEEGFTRGFLKAIRLVHRKTGADMNDISLSQVSEDPSEASGDEDIESVLKDVLPSDDEDDLEIVD